MAVNIDTVYQRVLAIANKEQRRYITPQEFNLLAYDIDSDDGDIVFEIISQPLHGSLENIRAIANYLYAPNLIGVKMMKTYPKHNF